MQRSTQPTYEQGLGAIGRYLDQHGYEDLMLCELGDGFVGRVTLAGRLVEAIPFPTADLLALVRQSYDDAPAPSPQAQGSFIRRTTGNYHAFLGALGAQCDLMQASAVLVMELSNVVLVTFRGPADVVKAADAPVNEFLYDDTGIHQLLDASALQGH